MPGELEISAKRHYIMAGPQCGVKQLKVPKRPTWLALKPCTPSQKSTRSSLGQFRSPNSSGGSAEQPSRSADAGHPARKTQHPFRISQSCPSRFHWALLVFGNRQGRPFRSTDDKNRSKEALPER